MKYTIKNWPEEERPREKLFKSGEHTLSNSELIAILLRNGTKGQSAIELARSIIFKFKTLRAMSHINLSRWKEIKGLGPAKIAQVRAALEIGRRFREEEVKEKRPKITSSEDVVKILMPRMRDLRKEIFKVLLLNSQNRIIDIIEAEEGTVNQANPIIREVFQKALQHFAASIICIHNHPSGNPQPSRNDKEFTQKLIQAGQALEIECLDHIIIGQSNYFSFLDEGLM
ncbi:MAG: DNA repair protein RadC [Candidatus Omnitrophota bacterium]|nr:MAG: DNA repair protein RadC [Candidatus Omnitrophota bacterium]